MVALVVGAVFAAGLLMGLAFRPHESGRLSPGQLAAVYRREHQRQLDGRVAEWE